MTDFNSPPPDDWETDRDDEFQDYKGGMVKAYDGTLHPNPDTNQVMRFETKVQYLRYIHYETGRPMDELWDEYDEQTEDYDGDPVV